MAEARERRSNILIIDRSLSFGRLIRSELLHSGFAQVRLAGDTCEALDMMASDRFSGVLCDVETGPLKGPEFTQAARTRPDMIDPYVPIIMLSFMPTLHAISQCRDAGANTFLAKPVCNTQLTEKLRGVLSETRRFVRAMSYFGPERRKGARPAYLGEERRRARQVENQITFSRRDNQILLPQREREIVLPAEEINIGVPVEDTQFALPFDLPRSAI